MSSPCTYIICYTRTTSFFDSVFVCLFAFLCSADLSTLTSKFPSWWWLLWSSHPGGTWLSQIVSNTEINESATCWERLFQKLGCVPWHGIGGNSIKFTRRLLQCWLPGDCPRVCCIWCQVGTPIYVSLTIQASVGSSATILRQSLSPFEVFVGGAT